MQIKDNYEDIHGKVEVKNIRLTRINRKERSKYVDLIVSYKNEKIILIQFMLETSCLVLIN